MVKFTLFALAGFALAIQAVQAAEVPLPPIAARAWLVMDVTSGQTLGSVNAAERAEPASLTKLMTAYLAFEALKEKRLSLDQKVSVSERAAKAGGSRMYLQPNAPVTVDQLLQGVIVVSGNDACIALAEADAGSEEAFVAHMNREANRLGMANTHFTNANGLPDPAQYTTAQDLALLAAALMRDFPEYYQRYYALKEFRYNGITQPNRNRLLWLDPNVDGVKTGQTEAAGYCLIASAKRDKRRVLSVLLGASNEATRVQESQKLLNFAFLNYDDVPLYSAGKPVSELPVWKGSDRRVKAGVASDLTVSVPRGTADKLKAELVSQQPLLAPVLAGQRVGTIKVAFDGKPLGEYPVVAMETVGVAGAFGRAFDTVRLWLK